MVLQKPWGDVRSVGPNISQTVSRTAVSSATDQTHLEEAPNLPWSAGRAGAQCWWAWALQDNLPPILCHLAGTKGQFVSGQTGQMIPEQSKKQQDKTGPHFSSIGLPDSPWSSDLKPLIAEVAVLTSLANFHMQIGPHLAHLMNNLYYCYWCPRQHR